MQIKHNLQTSCSCPCDSLIEEEVLPLNVWITVQRIESPVPNWDSDMIQSDSRNLVEVALCYP
jgi:hypothetical protein